VLWESQGEIWDTEAVWQEAMFYFPGKTQADLYPKAEPREQRGLTLYTLASRLQRQKARSNPYMVIFNSIDYFTLVLHNFPPPSATWPSSCSDSSGFISLPCHPYLPATLPELSPISSDPPAAIEWSESLRMWSKIIWGQIPEPYLLRLIKSQSLSVRPRNLKFKQTPM
jgi:hypothetical protein